MVKRIKKMNREQEFSEWCSLDPVRAAYRDGIWAASKWVRDYKPSNFVHWSIEGRTAANEVISELSLMLKRASFGEGR